MFEYIADVVVYDWLGMIAGEQLTIAAHFFVYDVLKILVLIFFVVSLIAFVGTYVDPDKFRKRVEGARFGLGHLLAASFGAMTPFCSCSSIPLFIGFLKARVPLGVAFSFLITSPLVNEVAFVIMGGLFGWKLAAIYAVSGILLGVIAGMIIGSLGLEKEIILDKAKGRVAESRRFRKFEFRLRWSFKEGFKTFKKLVPYVIGGIGLGAVIHGFVPEEFFMDYVGRFEYFAVPMAVFLGVPVYAGCSTIAPVIFSITAGGVPLGTSLAFMMSVAGLSLPEAMILKRVMSLKLLGIFFGIVTVGIVLIGWLFNLVM
ncbi:permease [Candidatus Peregrinibacteria bacterium]|jgi:uncharacterized protein|nr:permease [Candidatus Peregrinibacteria bacterium]MBT4147956.1 permease [Candidatus Peregrinibacteria bacterium]MBT4365990.1 permease [Candidatus Peregrinibacteria bacterium]MBT4456615.1 permease [Candidatus Peregrinibacteria bacterium]